jgi:phage tail sheath gpL-like
MSGSLLGTTALTTIAFNDIPSDILVPGDYIEIDTNQTQIGLLPFPARGLAIGQGNGAHTAVPDQIYQIYSGAQATVLFGSGSPLADMCNAWCSANPGIPLDAVMVQAAEGSVATV